MMKTCNYAEVNTLSLAEAARWYIDHGWRVFPCRPGAKEPIEGFLWQRDATFHSGDVDALWRQHPDANIGLVCGDGLVVLDLDQGDGKDGWASYLALGGDPAVPFPMQWTPGGGLHLLMADDLGVFGRNFSRRGPHGGMDMRTDGGYIVGAPSVINGRAYRWRDGDPRAPIPDTLLAAIVEWSRPRAPVSELHVTAEPMTEDAVCRWAAFLEVKPGEGTGDQSRDAFNKFRQAFLMGLTLPQAATVLPESWIGHFGAQPPHNAANPVQWAWKYVVVRAKESLPDLGGGATAGEEVIGGSTETVDSIPRDSAAVYDLLQGRCEQLSQGDRRGFLAVLEQITSSGLDTASQKMLWAELKRYSGFNMEVIRDAVKDMQRRAVAGAAELGEADRPIFVQGQDKVLLPGIGGCLVSKGAFVTAQARHHGGSTEGAMSHWLTGESAVARVVDDLTYDPGLPSGAVEDWSGRKLWNTYHGTTVRPWGDGSDASVKPWLDLLDALDLEGGQPAKGWLLDRLAAVVQYPGAKINHGLLFGGMPGIGKDSFLHPWLEAVGRGNVKTIHGGDLASDFSGYLAGTKVVVINEIDYGDHKDRKMVQEKLKPVFASPPMTLRINEKNLREYDVPNRIFGVGMTNHRQCLSVDQGERRYLALWCNAETPQGAAVDAWRDWFSAYWGWLEREGTGAVLAWLRARRVSIDAIRGARPPVTAWLEELMDASMDPLAGWMKDATMGRVGLLGQTSVSAQEVLAWIETGAAANWGVSGKVSTQRLSRAFHAAGWRNTRVGARRNKRWIRPGVDGPIGQQATEDRVEARKIIRMADHRATALGVYRGGSAGREQAPDYDWL